MAPERALDLIKETCEPPNIRLTGLMTIGPLSSDADRVREAFRLTLEIFKAGKSLAGEDFENLSMGMSGDCSLAIAEGATMIRVGTGVFGPRP